MKHVSVASRTVDVIIYTLLGLYAFFCILPFLHIVAASFTTSDELLRKDFVIIPSEFSLEAYRFIFATSTLPRSIGVTVYLAVVGTALNIFFTSLMAYPLAKKELDGRKYILMYVLFTMLFSGGMIPHYLLIKELGLMNSLWALMLPGLVSPFIMFILRNFFQELPDGIEESAKIDGYNDLQILFKIVLPLSLPAIATFSLFYAVGHWNTFMSAILYLNDAKLWPIQVLLRQIVLVSTGGMDNESTSEMQVLPQTIRMAVIVVATVPILLVYPFLQKHFTKGVLLGSVKG